MSYLKSTGPLKNTKFLKLGGWGLLGYSVQGIRNKAHGIDVDKHVLPYLQLHAEINGQKCSRKRKNFNQLTVEYLSQFDIILGADICFWDEMYGNNCSD